MRFIRLFVALAICTACNDQAVEVEFTEPLGGVDATGFKPRWQGRYVAANDSGQCIVVLPKTLLHQYWLKLGWQRKRGLDSLRKTSVSPATPLRIEPAQGDSSQVWIRSSDTLFALAKPNSRLGQKGNDFYLNTLRESSGSWEVQKLHIHNRRLELANFTNDTLRLAVLKDLGVLRLDPDQRKNPCRYLVHFATARQRRIMLRYEGLWQPVFVDYVRQ